jgi:polyisoprenoid-binding protein YceI
MAWQIDPAHTEVQFAVRHMGLATVRGTFSGVKGTLELEGGHPAAVDVSIDVATVHTREPRRDEHLRSADFFDAEKHPAITFRSRRTEPVGPGRARLVGDLTMHGVTREVVLDVETTQPVDDPFGMRRVGLSATGAIDRKDFGLTYNQVLEFGGVLVSDQVRLAIDGEAVQPKSA